MYISEIKKNNIIIHLVNLINGKIFVNITNTKRYVYYYYTKYKKKLSLGKLFYTQNICLKKCFFFANTKTEIYLEVS